MLQLLFESTDSLVVDTTSLGYRIGYIGASWLPFIIIAILFLLIIRKRYKVPDK
ncbi:MAG: hypothetical protein IPH57_01665 [Saprospiraceae bacterium]|nr:hypothetical protein [Saprospiraceae bacterium]